VTFAGSTEAAYGDDVAVTVELNGTVEQGDFSFGGSVGATIKETALGDINTSIAIQQDGAINMSLSLAATPLPFDGNADISIDVTRDSDDEISGDLELKAMFGENFSFNASLQLQPDFNDLDQSAFSIGARYELNW